MELYLINGSPNGRKVLSVINHLGITPEVTLHWLDVFSGDTRAPRYAALNPNHLSPTLVDGDLTLWESNAINGYLCDRMGGHSLWPQALDQRADVNRWLAWELAHFNKCLGVISFEAVAKPMVGMGETNQPVVDYYLDLFPRFAGVLEQHLAGRSCVVGDSWTIADYAICHQEMFQHAMPIDWAPYPNICSYFDRMRNNPHWAATAVSPKEMGRIPHGVAS